MGTIQKRKQKSGAFSFRAMVRVRGHEHLTKTFARKTDAAAWIRKTETLIDGGAVASGEAERTTLYEALARYAREVTPKKKSAKRESERIKVWQANPLAQRFMSKLRGADFADYRDSRREEGAAENTIRLELMLISHVFSTAVKEWRMEGLRNPISTMTLPAGSNERTRRLQEGEEASLLKALTAEGSYYAPVATFAIETAMRRGEILGLLWGAVDLQKKIAKLADTKNNEPRDVPLSSRSIAILKGLPRPIGQAAKVFPITQSGLIGAFRRACAAAEIEDLRLHDLRHEATSRFFERGLNVAEVAAITGHKTWSQLRRYTQLRAEDLARKLA